MRKANPSGPIGSRIAASGLTQNEVAEQAGLGANRLSELINGRRTPLPEQLAAIARVLDCKAADLLDAVTSG